MVRHALDEGRTALESARQERLDALHGADEAEVEKASCDEELREATDWAARTEAHAEALARALDELSGAGGRAIIGELDGVLGAFLDLIEIEGGWERAVESAAGASVGAMVVDGRQSARASLEALRRENGAGLILPVAESEIDTPSTPPGCEALRPLVRARKQGADARHARAGRSVLARLHRPGLGIGDGRGAGESRADHRDARRRPLRVVRVAHRLRSRGGDPIGGRRGPAGRSRRDRGRRARARSTQGRRHDRHRRSTTVEPRDIARSPGARRARAPRRRRTSTGRADRSTQCRRGDAA